jgi:tetraacyldisaccharide 4'-kinase
MTNEQKDAVTKKLAKYQKKIFFSKINYAALAPISKMVVKDIQKVLIVSGIANPQAMLNHLSAIYTTEHINFSDHHEFSQKDIEIIHKKFDTFANRNSIIVTTHKDFMRLKNVLSQLHLEKYPWYILPMTITIENENEFNQLIRNYVRKI